MVSSSRPGRSLAVVLCLATAAACGDKSTAEGPSEATAATSSPNASTAAASASAAEASPSASAQDAKPAPSESASATASSSASASPTTPPPGPVIPAGASNAFAHLASDCQLVVGSDLVRLKSHAAFAKEVVPKLEALLAGKSAKGGKAERIRDYMNQMGLTVDSPKNVAVCARGWGEGKPTFGMLLGSDLKAGSFVSLLEKDPKGDALGKLSELDGVKVLSSDKVVIGQLPDGVFALADKQEIFKSLIPSADHLKNYEIDATKELALYVGEELIDKEFSKPGKKGAELFEDVKVIHAYMDLAKNEIVLRAVCDSAVGAMKLSAIITLAKDKIADDKLKDNPFGAADMVRSTTTKTEGSDVIIRMTIPAASAGELAKVAGAELEKLIKKL